MTRTARESLAALVANARAGDSGSGAVHEARVPSVALRTGSRWFAVAAEDVAEVVPCETITRVPGTPAHILGVALVRSRLVPVADLDLLCGGRALPISARRRLVVIRRKGEEAAAVVTQTRGVVKLPVFAPPLHEEATGRPTWIVGEVTWGDELVSVIQTADFLRIAVRSDES